MAELDPTVKKETLYIAVWTAALSLLMELGFFLLRRWGPPVLGGNIVGAATAVGNYLLIGMTVVRAAAAPAEKRAAKVRASMTARLLGQAAIVALAVGILHTNVYATLLPLLFPRVAIAFRPLADRRRGAESGSGESEGGDLLD